MVTGIGFPADSLPLFPADDFQDCLLAVGSPQLMPAMTNLHNWQFNEGNSMNRLFFFLTATALMATAFTGCGGKQSGKISTASQGYDTEKMDAAIEQAKSGIEDFATALQASDGTNFAIKEKVIATGKINEFIWLTEVEYVDGKFKATVGDQQLTADLKPGTIRIVEKEDVIDWKYEKNGKVFGNYTLRLLIKSVPEDDREPYEVEFGN